MAKATYRARHRKMETLPILTDHERPETLQNLMCKCIQVEKNMLIPFEDYTKYYSHKHQMHANIWCSWLSIQMEFNLEALQHSRHKCSNIPINIRTTKTCKSSWDWKTCVFLFILILFKYDGMAEAFINVLRSKFLTPNDPFWLRKDTPTAQQMFEWLIPTLHHFRWSGNKTSEVKIFGPQNILHTIIG